MFGDRVKEKRTQKGLTQCQLAEIIGVKQPYLAQVERGTKQASPPLVGELAKALDCTADYLIYGKTA